MPVKIVTSRSFNQNASDAKRAAKLGPVFITTRGEPTYVLLSIEEYRRLSDRPITLIDALAQSGPEADFDFDPPRLGGDLARPADLS